MKANAIKSLLPAIFEEAVLPGSPLQALLDVMETVHEPCEQVLRRLNSYFDPRRAPEPFCRYLAQWVGVDPNHARDLGQLRELVARAVELSRLRGTRQGLTLYLETATGIRGFCIEEPEAFHLLVRAPSRSLAYAALLRRILECEKPAYVTYELQFSPEGQVGHLSRS
jgi:phage tail-like protein